ncbi:sigma-54-dependent transcriptional regulator [Desulfurella multipotens]|uniref:sigma-54-dependent transcriptional regulator n=3 Tax=Desulfurellaceae TaxID=117942 RepID=UPI0003E0AF9D|nr:sigma-54 dependent transcriptional regulator [Desulfurella multipotens]AHF97375.1 acetoacetate metabolism regulatory protein AtoC [Desulfurella acetivorans A63]PMP62651.1 MAG: sigma-54-dependent Fis family transcriptional regulator [Desulfurella multipotens]
MKVLIVDDDEQLRIALFSTLKHLGHECILAQNAKEALNILRKESFDLILSDLKMPKVDGIDLLKQIKQNNINTPFVIMTAFGTIETAVLAIKLGAFDFIVKPFSKETIEKILSLTSSCLKFDCTNKTTYDGDYVFKSEKMQKILQLIKKVANTDATVLLSGETGTGKEVVAKLIHASSNRSKQPFISVNCASIPSNLLESELFGYEKGAFSGAVKTYKGKFEQANGGTLLLDEISEMPLELQAKLLRVLQEKVVDKLGSTESVKIDVRIICTTNRNLAEQVKNGSFREDLFYRINVFPIFLSPLRERREDIPDLINFFIKKYSNKFKKNINGISNNALEILLNYNWPGNVRELENTIERAIILSKGALIDKEDIFLHGIWNNFC